MYIWEQSDWPQFVWDEAVLGPELNAVRLLQGGCWGALNRPPVILVGNWKEMP